MTDLFTIMHVLQVPAGKLSISYEWHRELQERRKGEKFERFKAIWTLIVVPVKLKHGTSETQEFHVIRVDHDWCSPAMVRHLVRAFLVGMDHAVFLSVTDRSDVTGVLKAMEEA